MCRPEHVFKLVGAKNIKMNMLRCISPGKNNLKVDVFTVVFCLNNILINVKSSLLYFNPSNLVLLAQFYAFFLPLNLKFDCQEWEPLIHFNLSEHKIIANANNFTQHRVAHIILRKNREGRKRCRYLGHYRQPLSEVSATLNTEITKRWILLQWLFRLSTKSLHCNIIQVWCQRKRMAGYKLI